MAGLPVEYIVRDIELCVEIRIQAGLHCPILKFPDEVPGA